MFQEHSPLTFSDRFCASRDGACLVVDDLFLLYDSQQPYDSMQQSYFICGCFKSVSHVFIFAILVQRS